MKCCGVLNYISASYNPFKTIASEGQPAARALTENLIFAILFQVKGAFLKKQDFKEYDILWSVFKNTGKIGVFLMYSEHKKGAEKALPGFPAGRIKHGKRTGRLVG